jgi:hypothetical protein
MTMGQSVSTPFYCPRCGGQMYKPAESSFYWHADNNHPRCDITNVADVSPALKETHDPDAAPVPSQKPQQSKGR